MHMDMGETIGWAFVASAAALSLAAFFFRGQRMATGRAILFSLPTFGLMVGSFVSIMASSAGQMTYAAFYIGEGFFFLAIALWRPTDSPRWPGTLNYGIAIEFALMGVGRLLPNAIGIWVTAMAIVALAVAGLIAFNQYRSMRAV